MKENSKDGKNPQDKGDSARHGIPKKSSISALKKIRSSSTASKRKKQLAHWQINMRKGKTESKTKLSEYGGPPISRAEYMKQKPYKAYKEDAAAVNTGSIPNPADTAMGPKPKEVNVTDRRRKKNGSVVLLKRFRKYIEDNG